MILTWVYLSGRTANLRKEPKKEKKQTYYIWIYIYGLTGSKGNASNLNFKRHHVKDPYLPICFPNLSQVLNGAGVFLPLEIYLK